MTYKPPTRWIAVADWGHPTGLDGVTHRQFLWHHNAPKVEHGRVIMLFDTRAQCRAWIKENYGYITRRSDLRKAPHWWRTPQPVKARLYVDEL